MLAHDGRGHRLLRDGVVVIEDGAILHVGPRFDGRVDETVDAADRIVTPGLISTHAHIAGSPLDRSFIEDRGNPQFGYSGLFEMLPVRAEAQDEEASRACIDFSMAEMLRGGVTTVMEIGPIADYVVARAGHYGMRVYLGLGFRSGRWLTRDGKRVEWEWNEEAGRQGLRRAVEAFKAHDGAHGDLVRCFFAPSQIDTCTAELAEGRQALGRRDGAAVPGAHLPVGGGVQRDARPPRQDPHRLDAGAGRARAPTPSSGHAIIVGGSSWTNYPAGDVQIMADAGCSVAHAVVGVRPARDRHGVLRALPRRRRQHVARHRHQSPERHRGHALGGGGFQDDGARDRVHHRRARLRRGHPRRGARARPRRPRPHRPGGAGRPRPLEGRRRGG